MSGTDQRGAGARWRVVRARKAIPLCVAGLVIAVTAGCGRDHRAMGPEQVPLDGVTFDAAAGTSAIEDALERLIGSAGSRDAVPLRQALHNAANAIDAGDGAALLSALEAAERAIDVISTTVVPDPDAEAARLAVLALRAGLQS